MPALPLHPFWLAVVWLQLGTSAPGDSVVVERERIAMGTTLRIRVESADRMSALRATSAAFAEVARLERLLSSWDETSAVSELNRARTGAAVPVDPGLFEILQAAEALSTRTGRTIEPGVGPLIDAWDLRGSGRHPEPSEIARAIVASGPAAFALDPEAGTVTRRLPGAWIDTGAFGKGAALAAAGSALERSGVSSAMLDFGGQTLFVGPRGERVRLAVAHPERRDIAVCQFLLDAGASAATSGSSERRIELDGQILSHIVDPRTGRPAPAWGSVTVVSQDPFEADALSTALYVMGMREGPAWADSLDDVAVLFLEVTPEGLAPRWNAAMGRRLEGGDAGCAASSILRPSTGPPSFNSMQESSR